MLSTSQELQHPLQDQVLSYNWPNPGSTDIPLTSAGILSVPELTEKERKEQKLFPLRLQSGKDSHTCLTSSTARSLRKIRACVCKKPCACGQKAGGTLSFVFLFKQFSHNSKQGGRQHRLANKSYLPGNLHMKNILSRVCCNGRCSARHLER